MTSIQCTGGYSEDTKEWLNYSLPNLNHLILSSLSLPLKDSEVASIFNNKIRRLDLDTSCSPVKQLTEISYVYFSNVQYIYLNIFYDRFGTSQRWYENMIKNILKNFKSLQTLIIYSSEQSDDDIKLFVSVLSKLLEHSDMREIKKNFQMKQFSGWILFSKEESDHGTIETSVFSSNLRKFSFFNRTK